MMVKKGLFIIISQWLWVHNIKFHEISLGDHKLQQCLIHIDQPQLDHFWDIQGDGRDRRRSNYRFLCQARLFPPWLNVLHNNGFLHCIHYSLGYRLNHMCLLISLEHHLKTKIITVNYCLISTFWQRLPNWVLWIPTHP